MENNSKIFVAGDETMIGGALVRQLHNQGFTNVIDEYTDLTTQLDVMAFFMEHQPDYVFVAARA